MTKSRRRKRMMETRWKRDEEKMSGEWKRRQTGMRKVQEEEMNRRQNEQGREDEEHWARK